MTSKKLISPHREVDYSPKAWFGGITAEMLPVKEKKSLDFWKLAVAPQQGEIANSANKLMRKYAQYVPGSDECSSFLISLVMECRERVRNTLVSSAYRDHCDIEFVPSMCRGLEVALCRIKGLSRIILSPFEHPSVLALARWLGNIINADVCQLHFEAKDYHLSAIDQETKMIKMIQDEVDSSCGPTALILSVVNYSTGLVNRTTEIMNHLQKVNDSSLHIILDGAHAAGNYISSVDIDKCWAYVISVHKWLLSPEPCGVIITPRPVKEDEIPYDAWSHSFPATTTNVRVFTSLASSLRPIDRVGLENWRAHSIRLRNYFIRRMQSHLSVIGSNNGIEMTSFIAVRPESGHFWKWSIKELSEYLEEQSVYILMLSIDQDTPWLRIAFPYTQNIEQVNELCNILDYAME
ncbi:aminotransferase class V-fold PLP-dependent enzyme [Bacillus halotolerans]|uniref:aminotransferase class V-fold PLP-dependent enzyme n=1 Tax=Bacillus halotolerans TaxID=260554 RepID=UPI0020C3120C|nr:aminotransferase class V-fold PLP-dependent enzyme [Bacillus halotolerans]UTL73321.1 aminotransferase class V-fold PLP-dependent enzyme [Bacillus halotolerans]